KQSKTEYLSQRRGDAEIGRENNLLFFLPPRLRVSARKSFFLTLAAVLGESYSSLPQMDPRFRKDDAAALGTARNSRSDYFAARFPLIVLILRLQRIGIDFDLLVRRVSRRIRICLGDAA